MFGFQMVKSSVFEWLDHSKTDLQNVRFLNVFGIRMFGIRAPTVYKIGNLMLWINKMAAILFSFFLVVHVHSKTKLLHKMEAILLKPLKKLNKMAAILLKPLKNGTPFNHPKSEHVKYLSPPSR